MVNIKNPLGILGIIGGLMLSASLSYADPITINLAPYFIPTAYSDKVVKLDTTIFGGYGFFGLGSYSLELGYDQILGTLSRGSVQQNYLGIVTYYLPTMKFKAGLVAIRPTGGDGNGTVGILGAQYDQYDAYGYYKLWSLGADVFYSRYTDSTNTTAYQGSPYLKYYLSPPFLPGWCEATGRVNGILTSSRQTLINEEVGMDYHLGPLTLGAEYTIGEARYGVYKGGFVVFNSSDKLQDGYTLSAAYALGQLSFSSSYQVQNLTPIDAPKSSYTKISALVTYHF